MDTTTATRDDTGRSVVVTTEGMYRVHTRPVQADEDSHPRRGDGAPLGVMVLRHRRHTMPAEGDHAARIHEVLGDTAYGASLRDRLKAVAGWLHIEHHVPVMLPVWGHEHGDMALSATWSHVASDRDFDSGLLGVVYTDPKTLDETDHDRDKPGVVEEMLAEEVRVYAAYLNNDAHEYVIDRNTGTWDTPEWTEHDSGGVYFSAQEALTRGRDHVPGTVLASEPS